jgi:hypothetical protein
MHARQSDALVHLLAPGLVIARLDGAEAFWVR